MSQHLSIYALPRTFKIDWAREFILKNSHRIHEFPKNKPLYELWRDAWSIVSLHIHTSMRNRYKAPRY